MPDTDQKKEDEVLRRMLRTPPKPHSAKNMLADRKSLGANKEKGNKSP